MVRDIPLEKLRKKWAVIWSYAIFLLLLDCSIYLDIHCSGSFSHYVKFYSLMLIHKISSRVVCFNGTPSLTHAQLYMADCTLQNGVILHMQKCPVLCCWQILRVALLSVKSILLSFFPVVIYLYSLFLRAPLVARNPNVQVVITHVSHVCGQHSFGLPLRMYRMRRMHFDQAPLDFLSLVNWSRVFWPSVTWNFRKAQPWSKSVLNFDCCPRIP